MPESSIQMAASAESNIQLPNAHLSTQIEESYQPLSAKRIDVEVRWNHISGQRMKPVRLVAWKYHTE